MSAGTKEAAAHAAERRRPDSRSRHSSIGGQERHSGGGGQGGGQERHASGGGQERHSGGGGQERHAGGGGQEQHSGAVAARVAAADWPRVAGEVDGRGWATIERLLGAEECESLAASYAREELFRSRVVMSRHGFGRGEYKYFGYPLPALVAALRTSLYPQLAPIANAWNAALRDDVRYPAQHGEFLARCHRAGQRRPTPLLLRYEPGDYNCLHQDLYGKHVFPIQVAILLAEPDRDFGGGELVLTEQRPRMQSRAEVVPLAQGDAVVFAVRHRPVQGARGAYRVNMRHGVSTLRWGRRHTLGVIFHDAT